MFLLSSSQQQQKQKIEITLLGISGIKPIILKGANNDFLHRSDDKKAKEYNLEPGCTLHLVLALRGGL
ncbi:hypothetical protein OnM2_049029 [Erysiphe neolycopersici]|uniref:Ubiquitin-like domain-containing protein n=1 Tax=Erysiphe neolycopersici TaxID=212602 RepID=A0A420HT54_9PEZI|nr:hypothetical protein OnM2_049029 [Erysiphe neolycopersici]